MGLRKGGGTMSVVRAGEEPSWKGEERLELRGGGTTLLLLLPGPPGPIGPPSRDRVELISGAGTRPSSARPWGRDGSMGGRLRSGGGLLLLVLLLPSGAIVGLSARLEDAPLIGPLRERGGRLLLPSSLRAVIDAATDSWLLLLPASRRRAAWLADRLESMLVAGDAAPLASMALRWLRKSAEPMEP